MPLWQIFHPPSTFTTPASKQALAADLTSIYTSAGLPAFYVVVHFIPVPGADTFVGGRPRSEDAGARPFVRFVADHIAVHVTPKNGDDDDVESVQKTTRVLDRVHAAIRPHVREQDCDWEVHIDETPRGLWAINGLVPPPFGSDAEKRWAELNRPVEWEEEQPE
ncbi:hypothetical protein MYCTH_50286 [Thermothelomyces thermophilus ATCC 42464]|uniref:Tautomerase cis-CaaD-like domain-containing protein n=1 Tax=Thermothelomyces thermophilus (strain ATCC 42464 / BCRC 31852 / DSM 1799) TaxID=573729 RepID=G2QCU9_THET4|nr:uncharacterized protein MYCTH_50286 [Thermothelomyces thermophilus ATCC 42464]AEO58220.1 hypothetical protein MYCTH_50286 [Thermothelomyces thermophilus ATCC 42464]